MEIGHQTPCRAKKHSIPRDVRRGSKSLSTQTPHRSRINDCSPTQQLVSSSNREIEERECGKRFDQYHYHHRSQKFAGESHIPPNNNNGLVAEIPGVTLRLRFGLVNFQNLLCRTIDFFYFPFLGGEWIRFLGFSFSLGSQAKQ